MLSIRNITTTKQAANYFSKDDYYCRDVNQTPSTWFGRGADSLGLAGLVERAEFEAALGGSLPGGVSIPDNGKGGRRPGFDLTFSAPKSVSLVSLVAKDNRVVEAHDRAVRVALGLMENKASRAREKVEGRPCHVSTDNLVVAQFRHVTSREGDPQLHTHCVVINATQRGGGAWRALSNERFYELKMLGGAAYRNTLREGLRGLGYRSQDTHADGRFEVSGFTDRQLQIFSTRRRLIENEIASRGVEGAKQAERVALLTRTAKKDFSREELETVWNERSSEAGIQFPRPSMPLGVRSPLYAEHAVEKSTAHLEERHTVLPEKEILLHGFSFSRGKSSIEQLEGAYQKAKRNGRLLPLASSAQEHVFTTPRLLQEEKQLLSVEKSLREVHPALGEGGEVSPVLNAGQRHMVSRILNSNNGVILVQGDAGTGKTTALKELLRQLSGRHLSIKAVAPTASAARVLEDALGIPASTVAQHLSDRRAEPDLLLVDEAALLGTRDMKRLLQKSRSSKARTVLIGDENQLPSIRAGRAFSLLMEQQAESVHVSEILRQTNPELRGAVEGLRDRRFEDVGRVLAPYLREIPEPASRAEAIADLYANWTRKDQRPPLVLTATRRRRGLVTDSIRSRLREEGGLTRREHSVAVLANKDLTEIQKREPASFTEGNIVVFQRDYRSMGIERGQALRVVSVNEEGETIRLRRAAGDEAVLHLKKRRRFEVFVVEKRALAVGDLVRFTKNNYDKGLINGDTAKVIQVSQQGNLRLRLKNREIVVSGAEPVPLDYGYVSTVHGAQGKTSRRVILDVDTNQRSLVGYESLYVGISRTRSELAVFTDSLAKLPERMKQTLAEPSAHRLMRHGHTPKLKIKLPTISR